MVVNVKGRRYGSLDFFVGAGHARDRKVAISCTNTPLCKVAVAGMARSYRQPITSRKVHPLCAGWIRTLADAMAGSSRIPLRFIQATLAAACFIGLPK